jgi:hypothetical protein
MSRLMSPWLTRLVSPDDVFADRESHVVAQGGCKRCDGTPGNTSIVVTVESDRTCVIVGVAGAGTKVVRGQNFLDAETGISKRTLGYSLGGSSPRGR